MNVWRQHEFLLLAGLCSVTATACNRHESDSSARSPAQVIQRIRAWADFESDASSSSESTPIEVVHHASGIRMRLIPAGSYQRGAPASDQEANDTERPVHEVQISRPFFLGICEVTTSEWNRIMHPELQDHADKSHALDNLPIVVVSVDARDEFLSRVGCRLPTEAEWELAARAGVAASRYGPVDSIAWCATNSAGTLHPVGQKLPNAWGLFDTLGNAAEWTADRYSTDAYKALVSPVKDPCNTPGVLGSVVGAPIHVLRGGAWSGPADACRASSRIWYDSDSDANDFIGLRVAHDL